MVQEMLAARGIVVSHETIRQWALKFGQEFASRIRRRLPRAGDKWHLDEVVIKIAGVKHWPWRAVDQTGMVLDVLVQSRRDKRAASIAPQERGRSRYERISAALPLAPELCFRIALGQLTRSDLGQQLDGAVWSAGYVPR